MTCKDCKLFDIEAAKDKAGRVQKQWAVRCLWVSTEQYPLSMHAFTSRPKTTHVTADYGDKCPCFQKRPKETA